MYESLNSIPVFVIVPTKTITEEAAEIVKNNQIGIRYQEKTGRMSQELFFWISSYTHIAS